MLAMSNAPTVRLDDEVALLDDVVVVFAEMVVALLLALFVRSSFFRRRNTTSPSFCIDDDDDVDRLVEAAVDDVLGLARIDQRVTISQQSVDYLMCLSRK
jgi:hypothetical protein